jgi:hypothetical protein
MPDLQFIKETLLELSFNLEGNGGFQTYLLRNRELHFHRPQYNNDPVGGVREAYRVYTFGRDLEGDVISFAPETNSVAISWLAGEDARFEFVDPRSKRRVSEEEHRTTSQSEVIGPGEYSPVYPDARITKVINMPFKSKEEFEAYLRWRWATFNIASFSATLTVVGDPFVRPLDIVVVNVVKSDGTIHDRWSGRYLVKGIQHLISAGSFESELRLVRDTSGAGIINVLGRKLEIKNPEDITKYADDLAKDFVVREVE